MKICIVGTGYVGLVTGACFAEAGHSVWCVDVDRPRIENLKAGILPIYEPGLQELVLKNVREGRLYFDTDKKAAIKNALFCFISVGTPPGEDGAADLTEVFNVARDIGRLIDHKIIVVDKSTVPVGTARRVRQIIEEELSKRGKAALEFDVVSNPEFLREGVAVTDFMHPNRVVIGTDNVQSAEIMRQLYRSFVDSQTPILVMDTLSAEITKYAANAMLATRISFINEIALLCDKVGANVSSIQQGIGTDNRIGNQCLTAGAGYGGSCFPKDLKELIRTGKNHGVEMAITQAAERVNDRQKRYLTDMITNFLGEDLSGKKFALWGLAFKPQTDDMREAPSITIVSSLLRLGATIVAYDPQAMAHARELFRNHAAQVSFADEMMSTLDGSDALIIVTEWQQFSQPDFGEMKRRLRQPLIFDGRNLYDPDRMVRLGFKYFCIGRVCHVC